MMAAARGADRRSAKDAPTAVAGASMAAAGPSASPRPAPRPRGSAGRVRPVIEAVRPQVEGGRYPAKAALGELVVVEADVFADGHDRLFVELVHRPAAEPEAERLAMVPLDNDRWRAAFPVSGAGPPRLLHPGRHRPLRHLAPRRGRPGRGRPGRDGRARGRGGPGQEGGPPGRRGRSVAARRAGGPAGPGPAPGGVGRPGPGPGPRRAGRRCGHAGRRARGGRAGPADGGQPAAGAGGHLPRAGGAGRAGAGPVQRLVRVLPPLAGRPRRHRRDVGRRGRPPGLRGRPGLRRGLPAAHPPDRRDQPQGPRRGAGGRARRPGQPVGHRRGEGGHTAVHPDLGHDRRLRPPGRRGRELGIEVALDLAFQCSPDHPWVPSTPSGSPTGPTARSASPRTRPSATRTSSLSTSRPRTGRSCGRRCASVVEFWIDHGIPDLPGRQPPHQAVRLLGVAHRDGERPPSRGGLLVRGLHPAQGDAAPGQAGLLPVVHVLRLAQRHRPSSSDYLHELAHTGRRRLLPAQPVAQHARHLDRGRSRPAARRPSWPGWCWRPRWAPTTASTVRPSSCSSTCRASRVRGVHGLGEVRRAPLGPRPARQPGRVRGPGQPHPPGEPGAAATTQPALPPRRQRPAPLLLEDLPATSVPGDAAAHVPGPRRLVVVVNLDHRLRPVGLGRPRSRRPRARRRTDASSSTTC